MSGRERKLDKLPTVYSELHRKLGSGPMQDLDSVEYGFLPGGEVRIVVLVETTTINLDGQGNHEVLESIYTRYYKTSGSGCGQGMVLRHLMRELNVPGMLVVTDPDGTLFMAHQMCIEWPGKYLPKYTFHLFTAEEYFAGLRRLRASAFSDITEGPDDG